MAVVTLAYLRSQVYDSLESNTDFYTQTEVDAAINDAIRTLNLLTGFIQTTQTAICQGGRPIIATPTGILIPTRITLDSRVLDKTSLRTLNLSHPRWMKETETTEGYETSTWAMVGITKIALHPAPATGGEILRVTGVAEPTALSAATDEIAFPNGYSDALANLASHQCMMKCGGAVSRLAMKQYQDGLGGMNQLRRFTKKIAPQFYVEMKDEGGH